MQAQTVPGRWWPSERGLRDFGFVDWYLPDLRGDAVSATQRKALLLLDTVLDDAPAEYELRAAHRALKGSQLPTEVYREDGTGRAENPYMVAERSFAVRRVSFENVSRMLLVVRYEQRWAALAGAAMR